MQRPLADRGCWQVRTSKGLVYELRHSRDIALGRFNDALFENIDKKLQAFRWAPHKILGFLLGNTKTRFSVHVQLRRLHYDDVPSIDWYISLSAVQGHTRVSPTADPSTLGEPLTKERRRSLGYIFHATHNKNWESLKTEGLELGKTRDPGQSSRIAIHMVYAGGSEAPRAGTHIAYGRYLFYCNVKYEELLDEGGALFLADNGVVLSYNSIHVKYLTFSTRPPHEKDPVGQQWDRRAREEGVPMGTGSSEQGQTGGSPMGEGPEPSSSSAPGGSAFAEGPDTEMGTPTFNLDDLLRVIQEQEYAEQTETEGRRVPKEEGILEVDSKISLERERILEQETLIRKMNANPWFLYDQGVTRLKWPSGVYVVSEYGDGRVKTTSWFEVPRKLKSSLYDMGPETWICHPFSGFSVYFFLKAHELGKWQGNLLMEMEKERVYTRLDNLGNPRTGYKSGFGDIPDLLYTNQNLIDAEFRDEDFIGFPKPTPKDPRAKKPSPQNMDDEEYAAARENYRIYCHELDIYREFEYIRKDFAFVVSCFSELYGEELFNYLRVHQDNHELRKRFVLTLDNGDHVFDCSLCEPFNSKLILAKIKKRWDELEMSARNFASHFARKAFNDLGEYDFVKNKHAENLQDLLDRPYEDILVEEIIDSLPSRTVVEEMDVEDHPAPAPAPASETKQETKEEDTSMEVDASSAAKKPRVSSDTDAPMEGSSLEEVSSGQPGSSSRPSKAEGFPMGEGSTRRPKPSTRQPKVEGSSLEEESTPPPGMEPTTQEAEEKVRQGVWGDTTTTVLPEAYELLEEDPEADSTPGRVDPQPTNEELVDKVKAYDEVYFIKRSKEYRHLREGKLGLEATSPIRLLRAQKHGGPHGGFYHDHCRNDPITAFKLWHMSYRMRNNDEFPPQHPCEKYRAHETDVFRAMARLDPVYMGRKSKNEIVFRAGDLRSTYDEELLEKSSDAEVRTEAAHKKLYEKLLSEGGTRNELQNAMLHYFLACKITAEEAGDLVLEDENAYHQGNADTMADGPPVYTTKDSLSILTVNLGNFARGRKKTLPEKFAQHLDNRDHTQVSPLVKSLARSKSHIACVLEANNVDIEEAAYLVRHGWYMQSNRAHDIMIMTRTNYAQHYVEHLAGSTCEHEVHQFLPLSYWVVEIRYGNCPTTAAIRKTGSNLQDRFSVNYMEDTLLRCGMPVFRICAFHMSSKVASKKPALMHEAIGIMLADCFHYQVDYITGDANMASYRTGGSKQGSSSIRDSCFQEMVRYYLKAYNAAQHGDPYCVPKAKFCTSNPLTLLRWMEDKFGIPWKDVGPVDWQNVPGLDCITACILEWSHTVPMEKWEQGNDPSDEYKVRISEWLLHSNRDVYLLPDSDNDSHTPLLVHLTPTWMSNRERRELRNQEVLKAAHDSRRERQRAKKRGDPAPTPTETPGKGSARPAEPENPPSGKGKRPAEPANPPSGKGKGKRPAEPADPPKGKGKKGESQKGKKGDIEKGKTAKGSSKGSTEKGKSKGKHYSKGKGQK